MRPRGESGPGFALGRRALLRALAGTALARTSRLAAASAQRIAIAGGGILGAQLAYRLATRGAEVTLLERTAPASGATANSFAWINAGWDKQRIIDGLVDEFGEEVLATPPKSGFDLIAWIVPGLVVLAGLASIPFLARAWARRSRAAPEDVPAPSPEEARRLDEELKRLR